MGGEKALALLEKALADQDLEMRLHALQALGNVGGEKALAPLEKALADQDPIMRRSALNALGQVDGDKARDLLLAYLAKETNADELSYLRAVLVNKFRGDPAVEKALKKTSAVTP